MTGTLIHNTWIPGMGPGDVLVSGNRIAAIGAALDSAAAEETVDGSGTLAWPGLVNTHHHLAQSLLKGIPAGIDLDLDGWLGAVPYRAWPHYTPDTLYHSACIGLLELMRSGCTLCADHHYLYHAATSQEMEDALLRAARDVGMRLVLCRGASTARGTHAGLRATSLEPENLEHCLTRLERLHSTYHDPGPESMCRVVVAPTSLMHACPANDLRALAEFARDKGLLRHSHLLEVARDDTVSREQHGVSAVDYAESVGWIEPGVWFAHLVCLQEGDLARLVAAGVGVSHCPTSNCRLGSGIAPAPAMEAAGMCVSLGVDGSASAESGSPVNEMMLAWLLHRAVGGSAATSVDQVAAWGTRNGADLLGFPDAGRLEEGALADLVLFDLSDPRFAGLARPEWAPVICGEPLPARDVMVDGHWRLRNGRSTTVDESALVAGARESCRQLVSVM